MNTLRSFASPSIALAGLVLALGVLATPQPARPCGALLHEDASNAAIDGQRALIVWGDVNVDVHVQLKLTGSAADAVWLIPVGAIPEMAVGSSELFDALDALTTPRVELDSPERGASSGCLAGDSDGLKAGSNNGVDGVIFSAGGVVGAYAYEVVLAQSAQDVIDHLTTAGFPVPADWSAEITRYVDSGMVFVAARLNEPLKADTKALDPLVMTMKTPATSEFVYPAGIGRVSSGDVMPMVIYQLADRRFRVANYAGVSLDTLAETIRDNFHKDGVSDYTAALDALTLSAGGRLAVTEYARDLRPLAAELAPAVAALVNDETYYLTRSFMRPKRDDLTDVLLKFAVDAPEEDGFAPVPKNSSTGLPTLPFAVLLALGLLLVRRRSQGFDLE